MSGYYQPANKREPLAYRGSAPAVSPPAPPPADWMFEDFAPQAQPTVPAPPPVSQAGTRQQTGGVNLMLPPGISLGGLVGDMRAALVDSMLGRANGRGAIAGPPNPYSLPYGFSSQGQANAQGPLTGPPNPYTQTYGFNTQGSGAATGSGVPGVVPANTNRGGGGGSSYTGRRWNPAPQNIENAYPGWWDQFAEEHVYKTKDGREYNLTPDQVYDNDGEYAVAHALADKAWGDQFYRTYGRPPSDYDWKASYYQRQRSWYGG